MEHLLVLHFNLFQLLRDKQGAGVPMHATEYFSLKMYNMVIAFEFVERPAIQCVGPLKAQISLSVR